MVGTTVGSQGTSGRRRAGGIVGSVPHAGQWSAGDVGVSVTRDLPGLPDSRLRSAARRSPHGWTRRVNRVDRYRSRPADRLAAGWHDPTPSGQSGATDSGQCTTLHELMERIIAFGKRYSAL